MEQYYKLYRVRELADGDEEFVTVLAQTFLEEVPPDAERLKLAVETKDYKEAYQAAHKMKPTIDLFELGVLADLIVVQDWGKYEQRDVDVSDKLQIVLASVERAANEIRSDFNL